MTPLVAGLLGLAGGSLMAGKNPLEGLLGAQAKADPKTMIDPQAMIGGQPHIGNRPMTKPQQPQQGGGFLSGLKDAWNDEESRTRMAIAFNSLRHKPDANLATSLENRITMLKGRKSANKTADYLEKSNPQIAEMLRNGALKSKDVASLLTTKPSAMQEKIDLWKADPEMFAKMKDAGVVGSGGVNIDMGGDAYSKAAGTGFYEDDKTLVKTAKNAEGIIDKTKYVINLLDSGHINTGWLSDLKQGVDKVATSMGGSDSLKRLSNTELLDVALGSEVFPLIKQLGIGARGMDTPAEREFLRQVMTGTATMTTDSLRKMALNRANKARRNIDSYNEALDSGALDAYQASRKFKLKPISLNGISDSDKQLLDRW